MMTRDAASPISRRAALRRIAAVTAGVAVTPSLLLACAATGPRAIAYGREDCAWCRMTVSDARYGTIMITDGGRQEVFDSIECLAHATLTLDEAAQARAATRSWVTDALHPGRLVPASIAHYLRHGGPGSPMGNGFAAYATAADAERAQRQSGGVPMTWDEALGVIARERPTRG